MGMLDAAILFATEAHRGQTRKYTGLPYITHPLALMTNLIQCGILEDHILSAAVLHDVVEDTAYTAADINTRFGCAIAKLVEELTEPEHSGNRPERKAKEAERLSAVSSDAQTIKYADLIDNTSDIAQHDPNFARLYLAEKSVLLDRMCLGHPKMRWAANAAWFDANRKVNA